MTSQTSLSQDEAARLRNACYNLYRPGIANNLACAVTEAMGPKSDLEEYSLAVVILNHINNAVAGRGGENAYNTLQAEKKSEQRRRNERQDMVP